MRRLDALYPGRVAPDSTNYPGGTFRDKSSSSSNDGTPIADDERLKDWHGAFLAILEKASRTLSGNAETAVDSDVAKAIFEDGAIGDDALGTGMSLDHFNTGTFSNSNRTFDDDKLLISKGSPGAVVSALYGRGLRQYGTSAPGSYEPYMRWVYYDIKSQLNGASVVDQYDYGTGTTVLAKKYTLSTPFDTSIPVTSPVIDASVSYVSNTSQRVFGGPNKIKLISSGGTWRLESVTLFQTGGDSVPNFSLTSTLKILFDASGI